MLLSLKRYSTFAPRGTAPKSWLVASNILRAHSCAEADATGASTSTAANNILPVTVATSPWWLDLAQCGKNWIAASWFCYLRREPCGFDANRLELYQLRPAGNVRLRPIASLFTLRLDE